VKATLKVRRCQNVESIQKNVTAELYKFSLTTFNDWFDQLLGVYKMCVEVTGKAIPLQALTGPEGSRRLRLPDFKTIGT
jgi:hypothetical protein